MILLLDTHAVVWLYLEPRRLSRAARGAITEAITSGGIGIAAVTLWEIAMAISRRKLVIEGTPEDWLAHLVDRTGVVVRDLDVRIAVQATAFPRDFPADPADRIISATSKVLGVKLVTTDRNLRDSPHVSTLW